MADHNSNPDQKKKNQQVAPPDSPVDTYDPGGMAGEGAEPGEKGPVDRQDLGKRPSPAVDTYDPGGMAGKKAGEADGSAGEKKR